MTGQIILLVEDNPDDAFLIRRKLGEHLKENFELVHKTSLTAATQFITEHGDEVALVLLDLGLPDAVGGRHTFQSMKNLVADSQPIVILTGLTDHDLALALVQEGAADFVNKGLIYDKPELLRDAVDFAICRHRLVKEAHRKALDTLAQKEQVINWMTGGYSVQ